MEAFLDREMSYDLHFEVSSRTLNVLLLVQFLTAKRKPKKQIPLLKCFNFVNSSLKCLHKTPDYVLE